MSSPRHNLKNVQMILNMKYGAKTYLRTSNQNVPHLLVSHKDGDKEWEISICYFGKSKIYRVFYPYLYNPQTKENFENTKDLINRCAELLNLKSIL